MFYEHLSTFPEDPIFGLYKRYLQDPRKEKINLGIGIYFDENVEYWPLPSVEEAKKKEAKKRFVADYLPIDGDLGFQEEMGKLILQETYLVEKEKIFLAQTLGATGALFLAADFLRTQGFTSIFLPEPTWANHKNIFSHKGLTPSYYPYFDEVNQKILFKEFLSFLEKIPGNSLILLHGVCHNPTGMDFSREEAKELLTKIKEKNLFPIVDFAYHGLARGVEEDTFLVKELFRQQVSCMVSYSCSKNFGLYRERTGLFLAYLEREIWQEKLKSQMLFLIRSSYSNPPSYGSRLVLEILQDFSLKQRWKEDLSVMRARIQKARDLLVEGLGEKKFSSIRKQKGLFSLLPLRESMVSELVNEFGIYLPKSGRINFCGISEKNIEYLLQALKKVMQ